MVKLIQNFLHNFVLINLVGQVAIHLSNFLVAKINFLLKTS